MLLATDDHDGTVMREVEAEKERRPSLPPSLPPARHLPPSLPAASADGLRGWRRAASVHTSALRAGAQLCLARLPSRPVPEARVDGVPPGRGRARPLLHPEITRDYPRLPEIRTWTSTSPSPSPPPSSCSRAPTCSSATTPLARVPPAADGVSSHRAAAGPRQHGLARVPHRLRQDGRRELDLAAAALHLGRRVRHASLATSPVVPAPVAPIPVTLPGAANCGQWRTAAPPRTPPLSQRPGGGCEQVRPLLRLHRGVHQGGHHAAPPRRARVHLLVRALHRRRPVVLQPELR